MLTTRPTRRSEGGRIIFKILKGKAIGKKHLGRPRTRNKDTIRKDFIEICVNSEHWADSDQDWDIWKSLGNAAFKLRVLEAMELVTRLMSASAFYLALSGLTFITIRYITIQHTHITHPLDLLFNRYTSLSNVDHLNNVKYYTSHTYSYNRSKCGPTHRKWEMGRH